MNPEETKLLLGKGSACQKLSKRPHRALLFCLLGYLIAMIFAVMLFLQVWQSQSLSSLNEKIYAISQFGSNNMNYSEQKVNTQSSCHSPDTRHSWRSLSREERTEFIEAILCLSAKPSFLVVNTTIYDDFTRLHALTGKACKFGLL
jgi:hypothetical protein